MLRKERLDTVVFIMASVCSFGVLVACGHVQTYQPPVYTPPPPPKFTLTVNSEPPGARLYWSGKYIGVCPCACTWDLADVQKQDGKMGGPIVCWPDGQRVQVGEIRVNLQFGLQQETTVFIPSPLRPEYARSVEAPPQYNSRPRIGPDPSAEAEFQAALNEYNAALAELKKFQSLNTAYNVLPGDARLKILGSLASGAGAAAAEQRVEVARQRLEAARIKAYGR